MSEIDLRKCPNCAVAAIPIEPDTKPNEIVNCNNCGKQYPFKNLSK